MKVVVSLLFILLGTQVYFGQQKEFLDSVLDYFNCRDCNFVSLQVVSEDYIGEVIIENRELYSYLEKTQNFDKTQYKAYVKGLMTNNQALTLKNASLERGGFYIKVENASDRAFKVVKKYKDIDEIASKGCLTFIRYYFLKEELESIKDSSSMTCHQFIDSQKETLRYSRGLLDASKQNSIISKLFEWQISSSIEDISNELVIVRW